MAIAIHAGFDQTGFCQAGDGLYIRDPLVQTGLHTVVPKGTRPVSYVNYYDADEPVRCAFCDSHQRHNKGFTVEMEDGAIALCGKDCAKEFFGGVQHKTLLSDLQNRVERASRRKALESTLAGVPELSRHISDEIVMCEKEIRDTVRALTHTMTVATEKRLIAGDATGVEGQIFRHSRTPLISERIRTCLKALALAGEKLGALDQADVDRAILIRKRLIVAMGELEVYLHEARKFFTLNNLTGFVAYQNGNFCEGGFVSLKNPVTGAEIHVSSRYDARHRFAIPVVPEFNGREMASILSSQAG